MDVQTTKEVIVAAAVAGDAVIMEGKHGIGKSNIIVQFAEEHGYYLEPLFLSNQEVGDLIGIPDLIQNDDQSVTTWSVPIWLQRMQKAAAGGTPCMLFLDELNRAQIDVLQASLQLVLEGRIHEHSLPVVNGQKTLIVAAINPADDYQVNELDPALLDRFLFVEVEEDAKAFLKWMREGNKNQIVQDFIAEKPDRLHWTPEDGGIGTTPRSWTKLGDYMDNAESIPKEIMFQVMKGKLGSIVAGEFYSFYGNYVDVVKMKDIEKLVKDNKKDAENIEAVAELISNLMKKTEAIQKSEMCAQMAAKYMEKDDIYPFLAFLYSLEIEVCVAFLKSYRKDEPKHYKDIAQADDKINNKELFKRVVQKANEE